MKLFAGLGNPGAAYAGNRHNIGFMALNRIAADHEFGPWRARFQGHVTEGQLGAAKVVLLKPDTFMNLSGQSVGEALRFYKLTPADLVVFHDELDLAPGKLRVKQGGGHAGHNGLRSLHAHVGEAYARVRLGIGHPGHKDAVANYVLADFAKAEQGWLDDLLRGVSDGAAFLAEDDAARFLNAVALRTAPQRPATGTQRAAKPGAPLTPQDAAPKSVILPADPGTRSSLPPAQDTAPKPVAIPAEPDTRTALQRLADRFR